MNNGFENRQLDKEVTSKYKARLGSLVLGLCLVIGPVWATWRSGPDERQIAKAQGIAYQVLEIRRKSLQSERLSEGLPSRGPASASSFTGEGRIGKAPDGKPYFYQVHEDSTHWAISVWSEADSEHKTEVRIHKDQL
ncbi:MAG: hypothetical protein ACK5P7_00885 [Bdellovibrio sp.]|jgi:hypothetical protein